MKEVTDSLKAALFSRAVSPMWGTFTLSWLTWNWQTWYVTLFDSGGIGRSKIDYITNHYEDWMGLPSWATHITPLLILPALSVLIIVVALPWVENWLYEKDLDWSEKRRIKKEEKARLRGVEYADVAKITAEFERDIEILKSEKKEFQRINDEQRKIALKVIESFRALSLSSGSYKTKDYTTLAEGMSQIYDVSKKYESEFRSEYKDVLKKGPGPVATKRATSRTDGTISPNRDLAFS